MGRGASRGPGEEGAQQVDEPGGSLVVGAGPAGLLLAGLLAGRLGAAGIGPDRHPVTLLEKGAKPGRKLLASGSGQCNLTNSCTVGAFLTHYGDRGRFLRTAMHAFGSEQLLAWLAERGLECVTEAGGKVFPATRRAGDLLDLLRAECDRGGVRLRTSSRVTGLVRAEGEGFLVKVAGPRAGDRLDASSGAVPPAGLGARFVVLATGGRSYPGTGSEGDGYDLAAALGHRIVPPRPALTPLLSHDFALSSLSGLSFERPTMVLRRGGKKLRDFAGDLLITHEGLSGPGILDASRFMEAGDLVEVDFTGLGREAFREALAAALALAPRNPVRSILAGFGLQRRLAERFCDLAGLEPGQTSATLRRDARERLVELASAFPVRIDALGGWDRAMVTSGGVDTAEVVPSTMESRVAPGLFFAGELLDVDGDTGGFNLQAAFSTAALAAGTIAKRVMTGS